MTVSYLGPDSIALQKWIALVSAGTYFQAFVGAADAGEAAAKLYEVELEESEAEAKADRRPCGFVDIELAGEVGGSGVFAGTAILRLEKTRDPAHSATEAFRDFSNHVGLIFQEVLANAAADGTGTLLNTVRLEEKPSGPFRNREPRRAADGDLFFVTARFAYGPKGVGG